MFGSCMRQIVPKFRPFQSLLCTEFMLLSSTGVGVLLRSSGPPVHDARLLVIGSASGSVLEFDRSSTRGGRFELPVVESKFLPKYFGKRAPRIIRIAGIHAQTMAMSHSKTDQYIAGALSSLVNVRT